MEPNAQGCTFAHPLFEPQVKKMTVLRTHFLGFKVVLRTQFGIASTAPAFGKISTLQQDVKIYSGVRKIYHFVYNLYHEICNYFRVLDCFFEVPTKRPIFGGQFTKTQSAKKLSTHSKIPESTNLRWSSTNLPEVILTLSKMN